MGGWVAQASPVQLALASLGFFSACSVFVLLVSFGIERLPLARVWALSIAPGQLQHELIGNVVFVLVTTLSFTLVLASDQWPLMAAALFLPLLV